MKLCIPFWLLDGHPLPIVRCPDESLYSDPINSFYAFDDAWYRMSKPDVLISSREFWGEQVEFVISEHETPIAIASEDSKELRITLANFKLLQDRIQQSLSDVKEVTYPPPRVLLAMFDETLFREWDDIDFFELSGDGSHFIQAIESKIAESVPMLQSVVLMFLCSVICEEDFFDEPPLTADVVGPYSQKQWAEILDTSDRSIRDWLNLSPQKLKKHRSSRKSQIWLYRDSLKIPPDIDERIENYKRKKREVTGKTS